MLAEDCTTTLVLPLVLENSTNLSWLMPLLPTQPRSAAQVMAKDGADLLVPRTSCTWWKVVAVAGTSAESATIWTCTPRL